MSIDKAATTAPQGIAALAASEEPIEIEIILPGDEAHEDDDENENDEFDKNLAETLDNSILGSIASDLEADYEKDCRDRKEWLDVYVKGLKLLGLKYDERTEPWAGACGVNHPLLMESMVRFQSETIVETFPAAGPVKTIVIGKETPEKLAAATRVKDDMNYQVTEVMSEYRTEHERMLLTLCASGNAFKKIYFDPTMGRQVAMYIPAEDIIVPYGASNLESADRVTHKMRKTENELAKLMKSGFYRDIPLGKPVLVMDEMEKQKALDQGLSAAMDDRYQLLEMHVNLDLEDYEGKIKAGEENRVALPYVVTLEKGTHTILAIRRNWLKEDKLKARRQHFVHYGYIPGFGFYYFGMIHLIGGHTKAATSLLRQLIDAGTLSNLPGGLKARGLRIKGDDTPIAPGEFRDVDLPSGAIRDNILPLPYKEPSATLLQLMDKVIEDGRRFAAVADLKISDMSSQAPVGTTLAILERTLKVMSAVQARIYYTMKQEFKLLAAIIRDNTDEDYDYEPEAGTKGAKRSDYDQCDIIPCSDPNASTMSQRVVQFQAVLQLSALAPQIYDLPYLHRSMIETLGVKNANRIVPLKEDMRPVDPVSENMALLMGKPVKAFINQDHEAHLAVHMSAMQDPKIMQVVGQNPQAQMIVGAAYAHVMEHVGFHYRREIEKQLGGSYPPPPNYDNDTGYLPPEIESQLSSLAASAAAKLLKKDQQEAQAQQAAQAAQDPLIQMQQQELQIKAGELQLKQQIAQQDAQIEQLKQQIAQGELHRKQQKDLLDAAAKKDQIQAQRDAADKTNQLEGAKLGIQSQHQNKQLMVQASQQADQHELERSKHELEGVKLGLETSHRKAELAADLHKHRVDQNTDLRKHNATLRTDLHTHRSDLDQEQSLQSQDQQHEKELEAAKQQHEQSEAEKDRQSEEKKAKLQAEAAKAAAKSAAKNKPKPAGKK